METDTTATGASRGPRRLSRRQDSGPRLLGAIRVHALKDVRLALGEAERAGVLMPALRVVRDRLITGIARGYAARDWSALGMLAAEEAGLGLEGSQADA